MKKLTVLLAVLLLAACAGGARNNGVRPTVYDFGQPVARLVADGEWSRLALEVKAPFWFDSPSIEYRLAYEDPLKLRDYAGSRWVGAPALLLGQRLRQQLGVASTTSNVAVDCLLRLELHEFSQVFDTPQQSRGVLRGHASLLDARRQIVAERVVAVEQVALTPDARGGVMALVTASDETGRQLAGWLASVEMSGKVKSCRNGK